jgi:Ca2+-binding RTX toxin-like protein
MLGFGQNDDDVAVKKPDPEPDPEYVKNTNYTASDYASEQVGTSGNDTLGISTSTESVALFGLTGNDSLLSSSFDDDFEGDAGNDTVNGCSGNDAAYGGGGDDLFSVFGGMIPFMATRATI